MPLVCQELCASEQAGVLNFDRRMNFRGGRPESSAVPCRIELRNNACTLFARLLALYSVLIGMIVVCSVQITRVVQHG